MLRLCLPLHMSQQVLANIGQYHLHETQRTAHLTRVYMLIYMAACAGCRQGAAQVCPAGTARGQRCSGDCGGAEVCLCVPGGVASGITWHAPGSAQTSVCCNPN